MPLRPRREVEMLVGCSHGGPQYRDLEAAGLTENDVLDFSVCCNPYGPPPGVRSALRAALPLSYPDSDCTLLRAALSRQVKVPADNLLVGSGSMELLRLAALAYIRSGDLVVLPRPTFGEYELACRMMGAMVYEQASDEDHAFRINAAVLADTVRSLRPRAVFLCNPNNPTGWYLNKSEVLDVLSASEDTLLVLDEAYTGLIEGAWDPGDLLDKGNLVVMRSMTKDYGLAGLRLGYAMASSDIINNLCKVRPPWNVNSVAQLAGTVALHSGDDHLKKCRIRMAGAKLKLQSELEHLGLAPIHSQANFFLVKVGDALSFRAALLRKGFLVRDCSSFGLPEYVRIGIRTPTQNKQLVRAIREVLAC